METTYISKCCDAEALYIYNDVSDGYFCKKCGKTCDVDEVCAHCFGIGEVEVMERVYPGEPHMAPIGTQLCLCKVIEKNDRDADEAWKERE